MIHLTDVDASLLDAKEQLSIEQAEALQAEEEAKQKAIDDAAAAKAEEEAVKAEEEAAAKAEEEAETEEDNQEVETVEPEPEPEVDTDTDIDSGNNSGYPTSGAVSGYKNQIMAAAGISSSDYTYVDYIVSKESGWNYLISNSVSGAYGLCQALPGSKMSSSGSDWATNPETQMRWCNSYALSRYGSWQAAYNYWLENNWW